MAKDYVALGQIGQYTYGGNAYTFSVLADRIVLNHNSDTVLSDELIAAADHVAGALQAQNQRGHGVTGLGFNFETVFPQSDSGAAGIEFCAKLGNADRIRQAIGSSFHEVQCRVVILRGGIRCTLRIEPHIATGGANLFLSINGHQDINAGDNLPSKLSKAGSVREYMQSLSTNLCRDFQGDEQ